MNKEKALKIAKAIDGDDHVDCRELVYYIYGDISASNGKSYAYGVLSGVSISYIFYRIIGYLA